MTDEEIIKAYGLIQEKNKRAEERARREFHKLHTQCQGSECQNLDYPKYVHKNAPDYPYCVDCATDNAMIDRRDFEAVRTAFNDHMKDKTRDQAFGLIFGLDKPLPPPDVGIMFCTECNNMSRFVNGVCVEKHND